MNAQAFRRLRYFAALLCLGWFVPTADGQTDPLPSWNDGLAKQAILRFVRVTTDKASPNYVEREDRIATFDQDGTTWVEHPMYTQVIFCLDRVPALVAQRPELKNRSSRRCAVRVRVWPCAET